MKILSGSYCIAFTGISNQDSIKPQRWKNALGQRVVKYNMPVSLEKALVDINEDRTYILGITSKKTIVKKFLENLKQKTDILKTQIVNMTGYGTKAIAFETEKGEILKITHKNHFYRNRPPEFFDVPIYKRGHVKDTYYYLEEKLSQEHLPLDAGQIVKKQIESIGYKTFDYNPDKVMQIGMNKDGKLFLLDSECARSRTIFHTIFRKITKLLKK